MNILKSIEYNTSMKLYMCVIFLAAYYVRTQNSTNNVSDMIMSTTQYKYLFEGKTNPGSAFQGVLKWESGFGTRSLFGQTLPALVVGSWFVAPVNTIFGIPGRSGSRST